MMKLGLVLVLLVVRGATQPGPPHTLLAEYWPSPAIGVGVARPRFSWTLPPGPPGQASAGYRVIVRRASTGAVAWDSQQVTSGASNQVECGVSLLSDTHYSWQVQWWPAGQESRPSALSTPAELQIGLLSPADWQGAEPIRTNYSGPAINNGPAELMRSEFVVARAATRAVLYVSAVGWAQAYLNGAEVAPSDRLNPGRTSFDVRQWYLAYNVTEMLKPGNNTVGILLGQGWQSMAGAHYPVGRLMLSITNSTGGRSYVYTSGSGSWLGSRQGPIRQNNIYLGESYNGTMELNGWAANGFDAGSWQPCTKWDEFTQHAVWQPMPPIRALELNPPTRFWPVALSNQTVYVYEFPQNAAGWARLSVKGCARGQVVTMYFGEVLCGRGTTRWSPACPAGQIPGEGKPGTIDQRNLDPVGHHGNWHNTYVCKGEPEEVYEPSFMYTGHRFVELHGHPGAPTSGTLTQRVVHSDVEPASGQAAIKEYANFLKTMADRGHDKTKGLLTWFTFGDWLEPGRVDSLPTIGAMSSGFNYGQKVH